MRPTIAPARRLTGLCLSALLLAAAAPATARAQTVEIKLGTLAPKGSTWDVLIKEMAQKWESESGGRVKLRVFPGGVLGNEGDMVRKMRVGQLNAAALTYIGLHDITPEPQVIGVPLMIESYAELDYVMSKVQGELEQKISDKGYVVLAWSEVGFVNFFSGKAFHTVDQARSAKLFVWEGDPGSVEAWKAAGFHPVVLSATDIMPSLQTGLIDTVATAPLYALTSKMYTKTNHMLDLRWAVLVGATVVKKEVWDKVPADLRPRLLEMSRAYGRRIALEVRKMNEEAIATMQAQGLQIEKTEDMPGWAAASEAANKVVRGKVVPAEMFDRVKQLRDEFRARGGKAATPAAAPAAPAPAKATAPVEPPKPAATPAPAKAAPPATTAKGKKPGKKS